MKDFQGLPALPADLFLTIICRFLDPVDIVRCRRVSTVWYDAFTNPLFLRAALVWHHNHARDIRRLRETGELDASLDTGDEAARIRWIHTFDRVSSRYHSLRKGKPRSVTKIDNLLFDERPLRYHMQDSYLQFEHYESEWTYDSGLLVYADGITQSFVLMDVESSTKSVVPFLLENRIVRRIRLQHDVLIIEWAVAGRHTCPTNPAIQPHFVSAFDIIIHSPPDLPWLPQRKAVFRSEWKLQSYGCDLYEQHRFFSTHTSSHYAVYMSHEQGPKPNRKLRNSLMIWDIQRLVQSSEITNANPGPTLLKRFYCKDLDFYGIDEVSPPSCWNLKLDQDTTGMVYLTRDVNTLRAGNDLVLYCPTQTDCDERVVGIPILGAGPQWEFDTEDPSQHLAYSAFIDQQRSLPRSTWPTPLRQRTLAVHRVHDEIANISFWACQWTDEQSAWQIWISGTDPTGEEWKARLDPPDAWPLLYTWIQGDERWIVGQAGDKLHILRFESDQGDWNSPTNRFLASIRARASSQLY